MIQIILTWENRETILKHDNYNVENSKIFDLQAKNLH